MKLSAVWNTFCGVVVAVASMMSIGAQPLHAQSVTINIHTNEPHPLSQGFSGFNMNLFNNGTSYLDPSMTRLAEKLSPGWIRFPAGTADDDFDWKTGLTPPRMLDYWQGGQKYPTMAKDAKIIAGKSDADGKPGIQIADHLAFIRNLSAALGYPVQTIGVVNTFTDSTESAAELVQWAKNHGLSVPIWELANEPQNSKTYGSVDSYLNQVHAYANAIHSVAPNAHLAVFLGFGTRRDNWIKGVASYPDVYWSDYYYHPYPCGRKWQPGPAMGCLNYFLRNKSNEMMGPNGYYGTTIGKTNPNFKVEVSELNVSSGNLMAGTLYSGIFDAEYIMRLSMNPHVLYAGIHVLVCPQPKSKLDNFDCIIAPTIGHIQDALNAYNLGTTVNTVNLNFGYFLTATGLAMEVANPAINRSAHTWVTSVTGGPTVTYDTTYGTSGTMPAIFALGYEKRFPEVPGGAMDRGATGSDTGLPSTSQGNAHWSIRHKGYLLITNKSGVSSRATIEIDGKPLQGEVHLTFVSSSNPEAKNTPHDTNALRVKTALSSNPITVPPYSVVRVDF